MTSPVARVDAELAAAREHLRAPRAAAIAGILFSVLLLTSFALLREAVPDDPLEAGTWLATHGRSVALALNLSLRDLIALARNSFLGSFLSAEEQAPHLAAIDAIERTA